MQRIHSPVSNGVSPMILRRFLIFLALSILLSVSLVAQERRSQRQPESQSPAPTTSQPAKTPPATESKKEAETAPIVTHHELHVGGKTLHYTATAGMMPMKNSESGEVEAHMFYMAYTLDGQSPEHRPLTFSFNGGPGSASVWLHLGAIGPKRVRMQPNGMMPPPPYQLTDNEYTWLDQTDLVFIDPVGT